MNRIQHQDLLAQTHIEQYLTAVEQGMSALIRPREPFDGLDRITALLGTLSNRPTLVTDLAAASHVLDVPDPGSAADGAILGFFTSGSTGNPKCVVYDRSTVERHAAAIASALRLNQDCLYLALPPVRYAYGLSILHSHNLAGVAVKYLDADWGLSGLDTGTKGSGEPLAIYMLPQHTPLILSAGLEPDSVARLIVAGGRLSATSAQSLQGAFPQARLDNMYGQAEMGPRLSMWSGPLAGFREGNIGFPIPGVELELAGDPGGPQPRELLARSEYAMRCILQPPYREVTDGPTAADFIHTGDLGTRLDSGEIIHHGRADRWLNVAGTRVDLQAIERLIDAHFHPLVVKAAGQPARVTGDSIVVVEIVEGSQPVGNLGEVRRLLHEEIGALASMVRLRVVDQLSLGESGK